MTTLQLRLTAEQAYVCLMLLMAADDEVIYEVFEDAESVLKIFQSRYLGTHIEAPRRKELLTLILAGIEED